MDILLLITPKVENLEVYRWTGWYKNHHIQLHMLSTALFEEGIHHIIVYHVSMHDLCCLTGPVLKD